MTYLLLLFSYFFLFYLRAQFLEKYLLLLKGEHTYILEPPGE